MDKLLGQQILLKISAVTLLNGLPRDLRLVTSIERFKSKVKNCIIGYF